MLSLLVDLLYSFALDHYAETRFITQTDEYRSYKFYSNRTYDKLTSLLSPEEIKLLDDFYEQRLLYECMERRSLFSAGLSIGLALSRL